MHPDLRRLADRQFGVFTGQDARRAGYREDEVRTLVSTGRWSRIRRSVYLDGDRFAAVRLMNVVDDDFRALGGESRGDAAPEPGAGAGNDRDLIGEPHC